MPSLIDENTQFVDSAGLPIVAGKLYIGTQNTDPTLNAITIYSDRALTTSIANPQTLDADGRSTNKIWVEGKYSMRVDTSNDVQEYQELDNGETSQTGISLLENVSGSDTITADGVSTVSTLVDKQVYTFTAASTNTGAVTLKIDSTDAKSVKKRHDIALVAGDIEANQVVNVSYNGTDGTFEIVSQSALKPLYSDGHLYGLGTVLGSDVDHDVQIAVGSCADSTNSFPMDLTSPLTKKIDLDWVEGDENGGLASGARSVADTPNATTTYFLYLIAKTDGTTDAIWDTSPTGVNIFADASEYSYFRRIACHLIDGTNDITAYRQYGDNFWHSGGTIPLDLNGATVAAATPLELSVPKGIQVMAEITAALEEGSGSTRTTFMAKALSDPTDSLTNYTIRVSNGGEKAQSTFHILTDTDALIMHNSQNTNSTLNVWTRGWIDARGKL